MKVKKDHGGRENWKKLCTKAERGQAFQDESKLTHFYQPSSCGHPPPRIRSRFPWGCLFPFAILEQPFINAAMTLQEKAGHRLLNTPVCCKRIWGVWNSHLPTWEGWAVVAEHICPPCRNTAVQGFPSVTLVMANKCFPKRVWGLKHCY